MGGGPLGSFGNGRGQAALTAPPTRLLPGGGVGPAVLGETDTAWGSWHRVGCLRGLVGDVFGFDLGCDFRVLGLSFILGFLFSGEPASPSASLPLLVCSLFLSHCLK